MDLTRYIRFFERFDTPFYFYSMDVLDATLRAYKHLLQKYAFSAHYAFKANANPPILEMIHRTGLGADCVSGNEVQLALDMGFDPQEVVFAGVGKSDKEIRTALQGDIFCFNCESEQEIRVIDSIAGQMGKTAKIALRINPNLDAHSHDYISTGRSKDKFGISQWALPSVLQAVEECPHCTLKGLHFHIGSQITQMDVFAALCKKVNAFQTLFERKGIKLDFINLGGGLGIDYQDPANNLMPPFEDFFDTIHTHLQLHKGQKLHLEPGRSLVGQCGFLITRVLYVKEEKSRRFVVVDAGMNDLIRPALYGASHRIVNLCSTARKKKYTVVGPVCESSDCFSDEVLLPETQRGDLLAICSAGAYGQVMAMRYNRRDLAPAFYSTEI